MWMRHDLPAGLIVFLVALPLCLGIALASGAPVYSGILSGIIGGLVVSLVSGSHLSVSGPAAGLTTLVSATILSLGDYRLFLLSVMVAGLFQLAIGFLKAGKISNYFPSSVIKGMLAAIGILLISKQIPMALGYERPDFWTSGFPKLFSSTEFRSNFNHLNYNVARGAITISVVSLVILILWQQPFAKKWRKLPAPLAVVLTGILLHAVFTYWLPGVFLKPTQSVNIPANVFADIKFPDFSQLFSNSEVWKAGLLIGMLASLETLLCVEAVDKLDRHNRITPVNRELVAQGIGNMLCGLLGAIPMTAVVVRGAANADAGARTKLSAFTHGAFLLLAVLLIPFLLNMIPLASLAAILILTGYNLAKPKLFRNMWSLGMKQFLPFIITIVMILATDLLIGVSIGLLISIYFIVQNNFRDEFRVVHHKQHETEFYEIRLNSNVTFLNKVKLRDALDKIPEYSVLKIDGTDCNFIDYDILEVISEFSAKAHDRHIELHLKGIQSVNVTAVH
ncbi:MAG: SulP family inorganic anion transporter [Chitinophagaceae bacterium]|nr:SulP family inorganic anion transporter [Chitinophagaceae bacterium]